MGDAVKRILKALKAEFKKVFDAKEYDRKNFGRLLDVSVFKLMMGKVIDEALKRIADEWETLKNDVKDKEVGLPYV